MRLVWVIIFSTLAAVATQVANGQSSAAGLAVAQGRAPSSEPKAEKAPPPPLEPRTPIIIPPILPGAPAAGPAPAPAGSPSPTASDDAIFKPPNYNLVGVTSVVYHPIVPEWLFAHNDDDCKINIDELNAAIDLVASHSNKLQFVKFSDHVKRSRELWAKRDELFKEYMKEFDRARGVAHQKTEEAWKKAESESERAEVMKEDMKEFDKAKGPAYQKAQEAYENAQSAAVTFGSMPRLHVFVTVAKVEHSCVAEVKEDVSAMTKGNAKFRATGQDAILSSIEMWSSGSWLKAPDKGISAFVVNTSETLMKDFIKEWTSASCLKPNALMCENPQ